MPAKIRIGFFPFKIADKWLEDIWATYLHHAFAAGIEFVEGARSGVDAIITDFRTVEPWMIEDTSAPLIVEESQGGPRLNTRDDWTRAPHLHRFKHCALPEWIGPRVHLGLGFGALSRLEPLRQDKRESHRPWDVSFVGTVTFGNKQTTAHRHAAINALEGLRCRYNVHILPRHKPDPLPLPLAQYFQDLTMCKIGLSPSGLGECCHRDFEVILAGATLVCPNRDHIATWPDIYRAGETYYPCRDDYADLFEIVERIIRNQGSEKEKAEHNRRLLFEETRPWRVAARIRRIFERCLQEKN